MDEIAARRRELELRQSAIVGDPPAVYRAFLQSRGRARLYRIDPIGHSSWRCEVWFGAAIHRTTVVSDRAAMIRRQHEYEREVMQLVEDGWVLQI